jgi:Histidine kinase-, DNA gyrase B-, and HSP90-like ATPase
LARLTLQTGPGVFEVLAHVCRSHQEAIKQFVENSADAIQQLSTDEGRISVILEYQPAENEHQGRSLSRILVADNGIGMDREKMKSILQRIGDSEKVQMALRGEKGIGILAFSLVAEELHLASTVADGVPSSCVVLKRHWLKTGQAQIAGRCPRHTHSERGTIAYLEGILPEIADKLTKDGLKEYLGREFASDLRQGLYAMAISDGHGFEPVPPQRYRGIKAMSNTISLGRLGTVHVDLHVLPWEMADATVSLYGRGGTRICLLSDLDDFKSLPWIDKRLEGYVRCDHLKRTADKTAVVQEQVYQAFVAALRGVEPEIKDMIGKISAESQERRFQVVMGKAGKLIDKFLRYRDRGLLADLAMRTPGVGQVKRAISKALDGEEKPEAASDKQSTPRAPVYTKAPFIELRPPPRAKAELRSWYDPKTGCICVNREHEEFMLAQRQDSRCIRYLFSIWAKESLLQEYGEDAEKLADEMVGRITEAEPLLW